MLAFPRLASTALSCLAQALARPRGLALWFLLCALPTGLGCALLTPVGLFPNETAQAARADGLLHGEIFGTRPPPGFAPYTINAGVVIDNATLAVLFLKETQAAYPDKPVPAAERRDAAQIPWFTGMAYYPTQMVTYGPILYVPGALGMLAGKVIGLTPLQSFYLGRVAMLLCYIALGTAALALARFGGALLFALLSLPALLDLASSYNQDGLLVASCVLVAALLTRRRPGPNPSWVLGLAVLAAVVFAKSPYLPLLLIFLPPVLAKNPLGKTVLAPGLWRRAAGIALAGVPAGLWLLHTAHFGFIDYQHTQYHPGPLWPGPRGIWLHEMIPALNAQVLAAHPTQLLLLPLVSLGGQLQQQWPMLLGLFSWDQPPPVYAWEYPGVAAALIIAALGAALERPGAGQAGAAGLLALALFLAFIGMENSMYLTFTPAGQGWIGGVHIRYFFPLLPFFIFLLPQPRALLARRAGTASMPRLSPGWFCLPAAGMAALNIFALPEFIAHAYRIGLP